MPALLPSELPVRARARHHWIVILRPLPKWGAVALLAGVVAMVFVHSLWVIFLAVVGWVLAMRYREWRAEQILVTGKRIIRVQGLPETTSSEAWLRLDRISGIRITQTVPGKLWRYATVHLEAPGEHPGIRKLDKIANFHEFYRHLRRIVMNDELDDPNERPAEYVTAPLPVLPERDRFGRRRG